jgi:hypothetical protein
MVPEALTSVKGLTFDPSLVNATPYWIYLAAGKNEQLALINYIRNSSVSSEKKNEWLQFLQSVWKKYPLKLVKKGPSYTLTSFNQGKTFSLTNDEAATFAEIEGLVSSNMINAASQSSQGIHPMYAGDTHKNFMTIALKTENSIPDSLKILAENNAPAPDVWNYASASDHSYNHGYMPLTASTGLGLAPYNTGHYADLAKTEFQAHDYADAFTNLGYSSHFMGDLGVPFHTPNPPLITALALSSINCWTYYDGDGSNTIYLPHNLVRYIQFHDTFEGQIVGDWNTPLTRYGRSLNDYANDVTTATPIIDPQASATIHADYSSVEVIPLYYEYFWESIINPNIDCLKDDPLVGAIAINRVQASVENIRGLVRYVTGGKSPTLTITASAGQHGTISPSGPVSVNYGASQTFTFTKDNGYVVDTVTVDGVSQGSISSYPFSGVTSDHTISVTFKPAPIWDWSTQGWGDWQHTWSVSGTQVGPNSEYGPVIVNNAEGNHGEHGTNTNLLAGSTQSSVWKTFTDPSGVGWNTITFNGLMTESDVPNGRWMTINVNGNQVFGGTASQSPLGNGVPFTVTESFPQSSTVTVTITNGQNPAWGPLFAMHYYSLSLSQQTTTAMVTKTQSTSFVIPNGTGLATNVTSSTNS